MAVRLLIHKGWRFFGPTGTDLDNFGVPVIGTVFGGGSGATGLVAFWSDTKTLSSDADFTFASDVLGVPTVKGGSASGGNLTLQSTSHATKGKILFGTSAYDEVNNRLGIGLTDPTNKIHARNDAGDSGIELESSANAGVNCFVFGGGLPYYQGITARGTRGSPTPAQSGDTMFQLSGYAQHTNGAGNFRETTQMKYIVAENQDSTHGGSKIILATTPLASTTLTQQWEISPSGALQGIGSNTIYGSSSSLGTLVLQGSSHSNGGIIALNTDTITSAASIVGVRSTATFNGSGDFPIAFDVDPTFSPSASIANGAIGFLTAPTFAPTTGVTIPSAVVCQYSCSTGSGGGAITTLFNHFIATPAYGSVKPTNTYGIYIADQGATGVTTAIALNLVKPTNATNNFYLALDTADGTTAGVHVGRVPVLIAGTLRYFHYYDG